MKPLIIDQSGLLTDADRARFHRSVQSGPLRTLLRRWLDIATGRCADCGHSAHEGHCPALYNGKRCRHGEPVPPGGVGG